MKVKFTAAIFSFLLAFFLLPQSAFADTHVLSGSVKTASGSGIANTTVGINDGNATSTTTDGSGDYSMVVADGTYNVEVTPPTSSGFSSAIALGKSITASTVLNFTLTPAGTVILKGKINDINGSPLQSQNVVLRRSSDFALIGETVTNASGDYSFQVSSNTYTIEVGGKHALTANAPQFYSLRLNNYSLTKSTELNINLPTKVVTVNVKNAANQPVENVEIRTPLATVNSAVSIGNGLTAAAQIGYGVNGITTAGPKTNSQGQATLLLFATDNFNRYSINAVPPSGSGYSSTALGNVAITGDTSLSITLPQSINLNGTLTGANSVALANQNVVIYRESDSELIAEVKTNSSGQYSIPLSPDNYRVEFGATNGGTNSPQFWSLRINNYQLTQSSSTLNVTLPIKKVTVLVQDAANAPLSGAQIKVPLGTYNSNISLGNGITAAAQVTYGEFSAGPLTNSQGKADLWLFPNATSTPYTITAVKPTGSTYTDTIVSNISVTNDMQQTITMVRPVTLNGTVKDVNGNPLNNQDVVLRRAADFSLVAEVKTNASGQYSANVMSDIYTVLVGGKNALTVNAPQFYSLRVNEYALTNNQTFNVNLPVKTVTVHVQDAFNQPVQGIEIQTPLATVNSAISIGGSLTAAAQIGYGVNGITTAGPVTNASGEATLLLFANDTNNRYTFTAVPPSGSIYSLFTLNNVNVTTNQTEIISLQYSHARPTTTASVATEYEDETISNPATVTLSASAASGYTVANTYYKVDGGTQQTYSAPFTVSGNGSHTVEYWSVDNSGVQESHKTKTFTIAARYNLNGTVYVDANQNGFQDSGEAGYEGATITLDTNETATTDENGEYTFEDQVYGTYEAELTLPNGYTATTTNPANVALNANTTQNFGIFSGPSRVSGVNVGGSSTGEFDADTGYSGGSTYSTNDTVSTTGVTDPAPQAVYQTVRYGNFSYTFSGLTPNEDYSFRLHFNELYWNSVGARVFDVKYNGQTVLDNYDIFEAAGGKNKAIVVPVTGTANSSGEVTLQFVTEFDNAMVNGIELYNGTLDTPTPTPTPTVTVPYGVNTGGSTSGNYIGDTGFNGGSLYTTTNSVDRTGVTNPAPEAVYKSVRYGNFTYTLPHLSANTDYVLRLHFDEFYWSSIGSRVFDVSVNGTQVLNDYDIFEEAGEANKAVVEEIPVTSNGSGILNVQFSTVVDNAMVNGIEVVAAE